MTENTIPALPVFTAEYKSAGPSIWQTRSADGDTVWSWLTWAFAAYWVLFTAGAFLDKRLLNSVGGTVLLGVLAWLLLERLWVRVDAVVFASLTAAICIPLLQFFVPNTQISLGSVVKHVSLCLVMAAARLLSLPVTSTSKMRWLLAAQIMTILLISLTIHRGPSWDGGTRHSGLFEIPNNLALIPFLLLFLINPSRDRWKLRVATHAIVVIVLLFTGTSGAMSAYAIGLAIHLRSLLPSRWRVPVYTFAALSAVAFLFLLISGDTLLPSTRFTKQVSVVGSQLQTVLEGGNVAYYEQERVSGPGSSSAIWRVAHWRETLVIYLEASPAQQLFGLGIGSATLIMGILPHNEYLRMLFEQGILGLMLFVFAWSYIIKTAPPEVRYIGIIVAIYSFSENNLDNFPFMALFILCLSARGVSDAVERRKSGNSLLA